MESMDAISRRRFLSHIKKIHLERLERRKLTASQFNVFGCLGLTSSELAHSNFLRFLLDPHEQHGQADIFLRTFLDHIVRLGSQVDLRGTRVISERVVGDLGRVDIAIHLPDDRIVLVENKVNAVEGLEQIDRYLQWLMKQKVPWTGEHVLIFLTPLGTKPISTKIPEKVVSVSYCDIAHWVSDVSVTLPDRLKVVLNQYVENCQIVGGVRMPDDSLDLRSFLRNPENIEVGFDVAELIKAVREDIYKEFWKRVKDQLQKRLKSNDSEELWEAYENQALGLLGIAWKDVKKGRDSFSVAFEKLNGETKYGICRGKPHDGTDNRDLNLMHELKKARLVSDPWWPGWRYLHNEDQAFLPKRNKENTIALLQDNLRPKSSSCHKSCCCSVGVICQSPACP